MNTPYIVDRPLTDHDLFFGREAEFDRLNRDLSAGQQLLVLYGKYRIGKTSFLAQLPLRLATRYDIRVVQWDQLASESDGGAWHILVGIARAMEVAPPSSQAYAAAPLAYVANYLRTIAADLTDADADAAYLVCVDGIPGHALEADEHWETAVDALRVALAAVRNVAVLLAVGGHAAGMERIRGLDGLPRFGLGPLDEDDAEDLLTIPVRGTIYYDHEAFRRVYSLAGGEPYFVQLFGQALYSRRLKSGWVGLPEVEHATEEVAAAGAPQFQEVWDECSAAAKVTLCAFAEMMGLHGVGTVPDVDRHLTRLRVQVPSSDIERAMQELAGREILEQLGGGTYRFRNELLRYWLRRNQTLTETLHQVQRYRRLRVRQVTPLHARQIDWGGLALWVLAGLLVVAIAYVWRSRQPEVTWTGDPTATPLAAATAPVVATADRGLAVGQIAYIAKAQADDPWHIYIMRSDGSDPRRLTDGTANDTSPAWSPDGKSIAFVSDREGNREVYVMDANGSDVRNLTKHGNEDWTPAWSPDGKHIAFASFRDNNWEIYVMESNGGSPTRLTQNGDADYSPTWSPDGSRIAFVSNRDGNLEIYTMNADGSGQQRFTQSDATDQAPAWSPDGKAIAWESYRDGNMEIYTADVAGGEPRNLSQDDFANDHGPTWSPDGRRIAFYSNRDGGWDIYTLDLQSGERVNITIGSILEQGPNWGR